VEAIKSFPFHRYAEETFNFGISTTAKQLGSIIDRLTYLGTCELFLDPREISLRTQLPNLPPTFVDAIVERQIDSLESSLWKERVRDVIKMLLTHRLEIHDESDMPIRKARTLIRCLNFMYRNGVENVNEMGWDVEKMGKEVERVLGGEVSLFLLCFNFFAIICS